MATARSRNIVDYGNDLVATAVAIVDTTGQQSAGVPVLLAGGTPVAGSKSLTTTAAAALSTTQVCRGVLVNNPSGNVVAVNIGDSLSQTVELLPGGSMYLAVSNVNLVFAANASSTTQTVGWIAVT